MSMIRYNNACDFLHLCFKIVTCLVYNFNNYVRYSITTTPLKNQASLPGNTFPGW